MTTTLPTLAGLNQKKAAQDAAMNAKYAALNGRTSAIRYGVGCADKRGQGAEYHLTYRITYFTNGVAQDNQSKGRGCGGWVSNLREVGGDTDKITCKRCIARLAKMAQEA